MSVCFALIQQFAFFLRGGIGVTESEAKSAPTEAVLILQPTLTGIRAQALAVCNSVIWTENGECGTIIFFLFLLISLHTKAKEVLTYLGRYPTNVFLFFHCPLRKKPLEFSTFLPAIIMHLSIKVSFWRTGR